MDGQRSAVPGTSAYFTSVLARIRDTHPDLPLDPVIVQSLLLCLVAGGRSDENNVANGGRKHLILRTKEEDIGTVLQLTYLVLTRVFGITTNKHKAKKEHSKGSGTNISECSQLQECSEHLVRSCFSRGKSGPRASTVISKHTRDRSRNSASKPGPRRSSTLPSTSPRAAEIPLSSSVRDSVSDNVRDVASPTPVSFLRTRPTIPRMETEPVKTLTRPRLDTHSHSEPPQLTNLSPAVHIPAALVVSGLEYTTLPAQRAFLRVLHERRIVLDGDTERQNNTWKLPSDFIVVYVCPLNAHDRPPILRTLLDRFGMSADINVTPTLRQAYMNYQTATTPLSASFQSLTPRSPLSPLWSPDSLPPASSPRLRPSPLQPGGHSHSHTSSVPATAVISAQELSHLRSLTTPVPADVGQASVSPRADAYTSIHPTLNIYLQDLFAAARHHPMVDGSLLTLRAHRDAEDLVRAFRVVCGDSLGADLISTVAAASAQNGDARYSEDTGSEDVLLSPTDEEASSLDWDKQEDEWLGAELHIGRQKASSVRSLRIRVDRPHTPAAQSVLFDGMSQASGSRTDLLASLPRQAEVWDVSEADIGKIFPRVISHRLRIRAGPDDEVLGSVMFPAAQDGPEPDRSRRPEDRTVKQIIIGVLADV